MKSLLAPLLMALLAGLVLPPAWPGAQVLAAALAADAQQAHALLGDVVGARVLAAGQGWAAGARLPGLQSTGIPGAWPAVRAVDAYLLALQVHLAGVALRAAVFAAWLVLLAPLLAALVVDGLVLRARKLENLGFQNPAAATLALHLARGCALAPLAWLVWPIHGGAMLVPCCVLAGGAALRVALPHLQPIFTR